MKKTFKDLLEIDGMVGLMYKKNPILKDTKFGYGYKRFYIKNIEKIKEEFTNELTDLRIDNALVDEKTKALLSDPNPNSRGFQYSKEGLKALIKAENELEDKWDLKEVEVEPYFIKREFFPENLTDDQFEVFTGVLLEE